MKKILIYIIPIIIIVFLIVVLSISKKNNYQTINFEYKYRESNDDELDNIKEKEVLIQSYSDYQEFIQKYNLDEEYSEEDFKKYDYLVVFDINACDREKEVKEIKYYQDKTLEITYDIHNICGLCKEQLDIYFYQLEKVDNKVKIKTKYNYLKDEECDPNVEYKPILYLYPEKDMNINIKLEKNNIITSYPKYQNGWNVYVEKNGNIIYNNRNYYALYWDEYNSSIVDFQEGFYVDTESAINFLEEKLSIIGLNERETNEFIMYWLPILEQNGQSIVYFELTNERELNNKLIIDPKPDSMLRINMHIKKVNQKINIKEQQLEIFNRQGFAVVEWGGTIHKEG